MSSSSAYDVDPANLIQVGFCRSGSLWAYKTENNCRLSPLPEYGSDEEPNCICGLDSAGEGTSTEFKSDSPGVVEPLFVCGPGYTVEGPSVVSCSEASPLIEHIEPEWIPTDDDDEEYTLDERVKDIEEEEEARATLYQKWCMQAWVDVTSYCLHTNEAGREAFRQRPNWGLVDKVVNSALANSYRGPGNPPTMLG